MFWTVAHTSLFMTTIWIMDSIKFFPFNLFSIFREIELQHSQHNIRILLHRIRLTNTIGKIYFSLEIMPYTEYEYSNI